MSFERDKSSLSKEEREGAERADNVVSQCIDTLKMLFPNSEVTVLVRNVHNPEMKLLGTTDDIVEVLKVIHDAVADWHHSRLHGVEGGQN